MSDINFFPSPLPDETLYSIAARYHYMSGNTTSTYTCEALFGNHNGGLLHDFPTGINAFSQSTNCTPGDPKEILQHLTMLPYFEPFVPVATITRIKEVMLGNQATLLKFFLCLPHSMVDTTHPLKACRECILNDIASTGFSYWHRTHQLPGVVICPDHRCLLLVLQLKTNRLAKRQYLLPVHIDQTKPLPETRVASIKNENLLVKLAVEAQCLLQAELPPLDPMALRETYRCGLKQQEWLSKGGNVRQQAFQKAFMSYYALLCDLPYFSTLLPSAGTEDNWLASLVRKLSGSKHPLKHLLLIVFLFNDVRHFIECHSNSIVIRRTPQDQAPLEFQKNNEEAIQNKLTELLVDKKLSLRKASQVMGLSVGTLSVKATRANIPIQGQKLKKDESVRNAICDDLLKGTPLCEVQTNHETSKASLYRLLQSDPDLQNSWSYKNFEIKRDKKRVQFLMFLKITPSLSRKAIGQSHGTGFKWLYRNDKQWLEDQLPAPLSRKMDWKPRVDWATRDQELASKILEAVSMLNSTITKPRRLSKSVLFRHIPELGKKATCLIKMPKTALALQISVETKDAYQSRRLAWAQQELEKNYGVVKLYQVQRLAGIRGNRKKT